MDEELKKYLDGKFEAVEARFVEVGEKFDAIEARFLEVGGRFDALEARFDAKLEALEARFDAKLEALEARFDAKLEALEARLITRFDSKLEAVETRLSQHLLHEMELRFAEVNVKLTSIDERLRLQAGFIQSGARALARFSKFAESSEIRWVDLANRVAELERKFDDLGGKHAA